MAAHWRLRRTYFSIVDTLLVSNVQALGKSLSDVARNTNFCSCKDSRMHRTISPRYFPPIYFSNLRIMYPWKPQSHRLFCLLTCKHGAITTFDQVDHQTLFEWNQANLYRRTHPIQCRCKRVRCLHGWLPNAWRDQPIQRMQHCCPCRKQYQFESVYPSWPLESAIKQVSRWHTTVFFKYFTSTTFLIQILPMCWWYHSKWPQPRCDCVQVCAKIRAAIRPHRVQ